jgi:hypothetical protein
MKQIMKQNKFKSKEKITKVEVTGDTLTGRGGLALFVRYLSSINIYALLLEQFSGIRRSMKGEPIWNIFKQIFCYFYDGTSRHLVYFDQLKKDEGEQRLLDFARPDNIILTNIGMNAEAIANLSAEEQKELIKAEAIINSHHQRGADELPHRGIKDFGFEEMPFKRFAANSAFYYCMVIAFFLFETFKEDVLEEVVPVVSYATTVRRKALDFAAKIVKTGGEIILKVTKAVMDTLRFNKLWERCQNPIPIVA